MYSVLNTAITYYEFIFNTEGSRSNLIFDTVSVSGSVASESITLASYNDVMKVTRFECEHYTSGIYII